MMKENKNNRSKLNLLINIFLFLTGITVASIFLHAQPTNNEGEASSDFNSFKQSTTSIKRIRTLLITRFSEKSNSALLFKEVRSGRLRLGEIKMKAPNFMRIKFLNKGAVSTDILIMQGVFYIHLVPQKIVYQQEWMGSENQKNTEIFRSDFLLENYDFSFLKSSGLVAVFSEAEKKIFNITPNTKELLGYRLKLEPNDVRQGLSTLEIWVNEIGDVVRLKTRDTERRTADYFFYDIRQNIFLAENNFEFIMPANVRIIKNLIPVEKKEEESP